MLGQTPSQTVGPFFHAGLLAAGQRAGGENVLTDAETRGERIRIEGAVYDGAGQPVPDALVEIWQADALGHFNHPADEQRAEADGHFGGFGRAGTDEGGRFWFETVKPGQVPSRSGGRQAPHVDVRVFARGMLIHAMTRLYFADETTNQEDEVLNSIGDPARRQTLIATVETTASCPTYRFDIHLQGERETVFFEP